MDHLKSRKTIAPVLLVATLMAAVIPSARAHIDELRAINPVGFSIQFGNRADRYQSKYRKRPGYNPYGRKFVRPFSYDYQPYRPYKFDWSRRGHKYKRRGDHRTRRYRHQQQ